MKGWVLSHEGDQWSVRFDVRDLGGHLDTTFRGWSSTLAARVRLVISRLVLIFALSLDRTTMKPWCAEGGFPNCREPEPLPGRELVCWLAP